MASDRKPDQPQPLQLGSRFAYVDSLRAIAALLVVWTHSAEIFAPLAGGSWLYTVSHNYDFGRMGVVAFFGVSGFLVPKSIQAEIGRAHV